MTEAPGRDHPLYRLSLSDVREAVLVARARGAAIEPPPDTLDFAAWFAQLLRSEVYRRVLAAQAEGKGNAVSPGALAAALAAACFGMEFDADLIGKQHPMSCKAISKVLVDLSNRIQTLAAKAANR